MSSLLDRLVFAATRQAIDPEGRVRREIPFSGGSRSGCFELWGWEHHGSLTASSGAASGWAILKFPGTGGRAERAGDFPAGLLPAGSVEGVWTINPPGYGTSPGRPALRDMPAVIDAAVEWVRRAYPGSRLLITGNSLGTVWALAAHGADLLMLRNPFCLRQMIAGRLKYNWWNGGAARLLAARIPPELDAIANAQRNRAPCLVIQSAADRMIPPRWQQPVIAALAGPLEVFAVPGLGHGDPLPESYRDEFENRFRRLLALVSDGPHPPLSHPAR